MFDCEKLELVEYWDEILKCPLHIQSLVEYLFTSMHFIYQIAQNANSYNHT